MTELILVDSHCHLNMLEEHENIDNYINRAKEAGVKYIQTICTRLEDFDYLLDLTKKYENVFASVGVHPSEVKEVVFESELIALGQKDKIIGLGETGLDYFYNKEKKQQELQLKSFEQHILAASSINLPVIIHTRDAEEDTHAIIREYKKSKDFPALIHCFTASKEFAFKMLDLGLYISFSGIVTFKNATSIQEVLKLIPLDRILIETDAPYLAPVPRRGEVNEPSFVKFIAEFIAASKNLSCQEIARQTTYNFFSLFTKAKR